MARSAICADERRVCGIWVVKGAPKRICVVASRGVERRERMSAKIIVCNCKAL